MICRSQKNAARGHNVNIIETGIWSKSSPNNPFGSFSTLRSFTGAVLPTEASERHTTPGGTQPSHDVVSYVVDLSLVLLELEKSGAPLPRCFILCTAAIYVSSNNRAASLVNFHGQKSRWPALMKSPKIHRVLVYTDREGIPWWLTYCTYVTDAVVGLRRASKNKEM